MRSTDDLEIGNKVLVTLLLADDTPGYVWNKNGREIRTEAPAIEEFATILGVDLEAIKAEVQEQIRAERAPKAPARAELAAQPEGSAKGEKSTSKPAAPAKKGKTSKEEASAKIAEALQELEEREQGENQAPDGAGLDECAAPAAPGDASALPQVGDRVAIDHVGYQDHQREGVVLQIRASGKARVRLDGDEGEPLLPIGWLKVLAASLWPFPRSAEQRTEPQMPVLKAGDRVKVRGALSGHASEHHGKEGTLKEPVDGTTQWVVNLAKPKKAPKLVTLEATTLEVLA